MTKFFYRVGVGETLLSVSTTQNLSPFKIIKLNNLKQEIQAGDLLYIEKEDVCQYRVKPTDTAKSIAIRFGIDEKTLLQKNGVDYVFYGLILEI